MYDNPFSAHPSLPMEPRVRARVLSRTATVVIGLTLLSGCGSGEPAQTPPAAQPAAFRAAPAAAASIVPNAPAAAAQGNSQVVTLRSFQGANYYVIRVDLTRNRLQLHWRDARGRAYGSPSALSTALSSQGERVLAITNGGLYSREGTPKGLQVERGVHIEPLNLKDSSDGNFFQPPPNAVFSVMRDGTARITPRPLVHALEPQMLEAVQSGPQLVKDGAPAHTFRESPLARTAVGVASPTDVFLVVSKDPVSLNALTRFFIQELHCTDAMFLDGGAVRGLVSAEVREPLEEGSFVGLISVLQGRGSTP